MRMRSTTLAVMLTAVAALAGLAAAAQAQAPAPNTSGTPPGMTRHLNDLTVLLDLTESQKLQMQQVLETQHQKMHAQFEQWKASGQRPTPEQMQSFHQQSQQELLSAVKPFLSESQYTKFALLQQRHRGWHHHHGAPPGGSSGSSPPSG